MRRLVLCALTVALPASPVSTQTLAPLLGPPVFVPGLYETESRNSAFQTRGIRSDICIASADFAAFQRDTIAHYLKAPQFGKVCRLSEPKPSPDGFAFAMDCEGARTIVAYRFEKDVVSTTTQTLIVNRPEYSSTILTLSRRIGACPVETRGKDR